MHWGVLTKECAMEALKRQVACCVTGLSSRDDLFLDVIGELAGIEDPLQLWIKGIQLGWHHKWMG